MHRNFGNFHSSVYGTEQDPHNCSFFLRIGACRHGTCCPKKHTWPTFSNTIMLEHIWVPSKKVHSNKRKREKHYERFLEDLLEEMSKYGDVEDTCTFENLGDHCLGNSFVKFATEDQAAKALKGITGRYYAGRLIIAKFSPVTDFENARCRDHCGGFCRRGNFCNFAHFCKPPRWAVRFMEKTKVQAYRTRKKLKREREEQSENFVGLSRDERMKIIARWNEEELKKGKVPLFSAKAETELSGKSSLKLFEPNSERVG